MSSFLAVWWWTVPPETPRSFRRSGNNLDECSTTVPWEEQSANIQCRVADVQSKFHSRLFGTTSQRRSAALRETAPGSQLLCFDIMKRIGAREDGKLQPIFRYGRRMMDGFESSIGSSQRE